MMQRRIRRFSGDARTAKMVDFKGTHYPKFVVLFAVFFYLRYPVSYSDVEEIMQERGVDFNHATIDLIAVKKARRRWHATRHRSGSQHHGLYLFHGRRGRIELERCLSDVSVRDRPDHCRAWLCQLFAGNDRCAAHGDLTVDALGSTHVVLFGDLVAATFMGLVAHFTSLQFVFMLLAGLLAALAFTGKVARV
uniref:RC218 n=1 Tax=Ruegeria sp. PR1b TaxID=185588 RepID=Q8KVX2_9RHOB|nr:RC218 [Ruegeria sp. PR1b]